MFQNWTLVSYSEILSLTGTIGMTKGQAVGLLPPRPRRLPHKTLPGLLRLHFDDCSWEGS